MRHSEASRHQTHEEQTQLAKFGEDIPKDFSVENQSDKVDVLLKVWLKLWDAAAFIEGPDGLLHFFKFHARILDKN